MPLTFLIIFEPYYIQKSQTSWDRGAKKYWKYHAQHVWPGPSSALDNLKIAI